MKVPIRLTVVMEYEVGDYSEPDGTKWFLEESHCTINVANALADLVATDEEQRVCNICRFAKVELLPLGTEAYRGYVGEAE